MEPTALNTHSDFCSRGHDPIAHARRTRCPAYVGPSSLSVSLSLSSKRDEPPTRCVVSPMTKPRCSQDGGIGCHTSSLRQGHLGPLDQNSSHATVHDSRFCTRCSRRHGGWIYTVSWRDGGRSTAKDQMINQKWYCTSTVIAQTVVEFIFLIYNMPKTQIWYFINVEVTLCKAI